MATLLIVLHVFVSLFLILVVLLQTGQADMGTAFGGSSSSLLGASGGNKFMTRLTSVAAAIFMLTSISLTIVGSKTRGSSVVSDIPDSEPATVEQTHKEETPAGEAAPEGSPGEGDAKAAAATDAKDEAKDSAKADAKPEEAPVEKKETKSEEPAP